MFRYINSNQVIAVQLVTPAENPLLTDDSRTMDVWFGGAFVRKQLFKKVARVEQELLAEELRNRGFIQSGNLLIDPAAVLFAEMENQFLGGLITIGYQENGNTVDLKLSGKAFNELCGRLSSHYTSGEAG